MVTEDTAKQNEAMKDLFSKLSAVEATPSNSGSNGNLAESFAGSMVNKIPASTGVVADPLIKNVLSGFSSLMGEPVKQRTLMESAPVARRVAVANPLTIDEIKSLFTKFGAASPADKQKLKTLCQMAFAYLASEKRGE